MEFDTLKYNAENESKECEKYYQVGWSQGFDQALECLAAIDCVAKNIELMSLDLSETLYSLRKMKYKIDRSER